MNKYYQSIRNSLLIALAWWLAITWFGQYRLGVSGVTPTFPYYNSLLEEGSARQAIWAHFDGAHYLHLAQFGYDGTGVQAFFPVYPLLISAAHTVGIPYLVAGRLISFVALVGSLICLMYLFGKRWRAITLVLLLFPTSFFLAAMYTESLFLFEILFFFVLLKRQNYLVAALVAGLASGTRLVGIFLSLSLLIDLYAHRKSITYNSLLIPISYFLIANSGFLVYVLYLWHRYGDPLIFLHVQSLFGAERSSGEIVLLPQVLVRYARMIVTVDPSTWLYQRVWLELASFLVAAVLWWRNRRFIPLSHSAFVGASILLPTLSGTLSSLPRYLLVLAPFLFPLSPKLRSLALYLFLSLLLLCYLLSQYVSGQFVA